VGGGERENRKKNSSAAISNFEGRGRENGERNSSAAIPDFFGGGERENRGKKFIRSHP